MARSKWKGPNVDFNLFNKLNNANSKNEIIVNRSSEIIPGFIDKTFLIHTGNAYTNLTVTEDMVGHKFGEFAFTRKRYFFKKKPTKNNGTKN